MVLHELLIRISGKSLDEKGGRSGDWFPSNKSRLILPASWVNTAHPFSVIIALIYSAIFLIQLDEFVMIIFCPLRSRSKILTSAGVSAPPSLRILALLLCFLILNTFPHY